MTHGLVLGKFLPPHAGHVYLVEFARRYVDSLSVVVGTLQREPIPGAQRVAWMRELFPDVNVIHLSDENPQHPTEHPDFWRIWRESLLRVLPRPVSHVFSSEDYGVRLAAELGAQAVAVDPERRIVQVSGSALRQHPLRHFAHLPRCVRPWFVKRVCVFGAESTGKSSLAQALAEHFSTRWVPEYARGLLEAAGGRVEPAHMSLIARGQLASEEALARDASGLLVCDTDVLTTQLWSEALYGECPPWIAEQARQRRYDLTLLCDVDVPFVPDPVRYLPQQRASFHQRCRQALLENGRRFVLLRGSWDERWRRALGAIEELLEEA